MKIGHGIVGFETAEEAKKSANESGYLHPIILKRKFQNGTQEFGWFEERDHVERIKREFSGVEEIKQ